MPTIAIISLLLVHIRTILALMIILIELVILIVLIELTTIIAFILLWRLTRPYKMLSSQSIIFC